VAHQGTAKGKKSQSGGWGFGGGGRWGGGGVVSLWGEWAFVGGFFFWRGCFAVGFFWVLEVWFGGGVCGGGVFFWGGVFGWVVDGGVGGKESHA